MTKDSLNGYVILLKNTKELIQTKRIRLYQREKLVDRFHFLVPYDYEDFNRQSTVKPDMSAFTCILQYVTYDGTIHMETLERAKDETGEIVDYEDADGNVTHMIYELPVDTKFTKFAGNITMKLNLQYTDFEAPSTSPDDTTPAEDPTPIQYVLSSDDTVVTILSVADYYSIIPDESLSEINNKIAELDAKAKELEATAAAYDAEKADNIKLDTEDQSLYLTANGNQIGDKINLNDLGDSISDDTQSGLVQVII